MINWLKDRANGACLTDDQIAACDEVFNPVVSYTLHTYIRIST